jgi:hypothetical protein
MPQMERLTIITMEGVHYHLGKKIHGNLIINEGIYFIKMQMEDYLMWHWIWHLFF